ncbi:MAG: S-layer homology domain-containing protein [Candidatus Saccharibacteria bacterium]|nr:S-layer homology domain-containing protein [Candidatus Saccharibacteria bacterium]
MKKIVPQKFIAIFMMALLLCSLLPTTTVSAASKKFSFADVESSHVYYKQIMEIGKMGGLKGLARKGEKFYPDKKITKGEFCSILVRLYGEDKVSASDKPNQKVKQSWATKKLTNLAATLDVDLNWTGGDKTATITRGQACKFISSVIHCDSRLNPKNVEVSVTNPCPSVGIPPVYGWKPKNF